ncbi:MAG: hypothetical protein KDC00_11320 [Flavobacteriales bacterium]|nr:hypothetical protein [Flavobacteriales bacterium]
MDQISNSDPRKTSTGTEKPLGKGATRSVLLWWIALLIALFAILGMHTFMNTTY